MRAEYVHLQGSKDAHLIHAQQAAGNIELYEAHMHEAAVRARDRHHH